MIVNVQPSFPAGTGRPLATYVLDLKHVEGKRLGPYEHDDTKHKVEWARAVNTGVDDPRWAIQAIELHNAKNLRAHRVSRWEHIIVSFAEGECPTRQQMEVIEDRLMAAIGFGDHPRLSAVHKPDGKNVDNWHLHIGVSRIDPTTLKAEHPRHNFFKLQAEAARLEIDLGLRRERKTVLSRERQEIDALARARDHDVAFQGSDTMADDAELSKPQRFPLTGDREEAQRITFPAAVNGRIVEQDLAAARYNDSRSGALYERYKTERENALVERKAAEQQVYRGFSDHQTELRGFYEMRHEQVKLQLGRGIERHDSHELLKAQQRGDRVQAQAQRAQQLAKARASHPVPSWESFLERESGRGDRDAARLLERRRSREMQQEHERGG